MADQKTCATQSENAVSGSEQRHECDEDLQSAGDVVAVAVSSTESASCSTEVTITPHDCSQTSASGASDGETCNTDMHSPVDNVTLQFSKCQCAEGSNNANESGRQLASDSASCQEILPASAHDKPQETVSAESSLSSSTHSNSSNTDSCNSCSNHASHSHTDCQTAHSVTDEAANTIEETRKNSVESEDCLSPTRDAGYMSVDQSKPTAMVSTPEAQSIKCSLVQSSLHGSTRQVKCRKTGHRRITANGANLSLGQLINAVSESLNDSTYIPSSSLSSRSSAAEHRMTPVKAGDAVDSSIIKDKLSRHFDSESVCFTGSPVNSSPADAQGSPQVVDGVRRPPKARKSCPSNDSKVSSDLPKEPSRPPGTPFGTVCLAELVDAHSLDKLDVRTFDEMLLAKMRERMRPSNGFKLLLHNNEQSQTPAAVLPTPDGVSASVSNNITPSLGSGVPLIPSPAAKSTSLNCDSSVRSSSSTRTDNIPHLKNPSSAQVITGHVWRCRKSKSSSGNVQHSAGSKMNVAVNHPGGMPEECDVIVDSQMTRRSSRCVKRSPSWQHLDEVGI